MFNNLGVVQLRRGASAETGLATYYFNRAAEMAALDVDYFFNLGYAYWLQRDVPAAIYWLREAVRRDPTDGDAHLVLAAALSSAGQTLEATRERELAKRLSSRYEDIDRRPAADPVPAGLERVKSDVELPHSPSLSDSLAASGQREQRELARFHLEAGQRMFLEERDRDALQELNRAAVPVALRGAGAPAGRPHSPAKRSFGRSDRRAEDLALERGDRRGSHDAR